MGTKLGKQTFAFDKPIYYAGAYSVVGKKEGEGPLGKGFDIIMPDCKWGEKSFEKAERKMFKTAMEGCVSSAGIDMNQVDMVIGGDLLNQIISASFAVKDFPAPDTPRIKELPLRSCLRLAIIIFLLMTF